MRSTPHSRRFTWPTIGTAIIAIVAGLGMTTANPAIAADTTPQDSAKSVIFVGDSVTAGFGYFGQKENAKNVTGKVNNEFPSAWYFGDNSLSDCSPPSSGTPDDRCSNNNFNGAPWSAGPWQAGPNAPDVAYSYQIAGSQDPNAAAPVENWAVTGSTPAMWDDGGAFNFQLKNIKDTHVVMTLGANPILASFLQVKLSLVPVTNGACADSTQWLGWTGWWAYPPSNVIKCADQQWSQNKQTDHLVSVYKTLLKNNNKVLAMGYYRACPWSFGVWQPEGNVAKGPAAGNSCPSQKQQVSECSRCRVDGSTTQWEQAVAAQNAMNDKIAAAVGTVQDWARGQSGMKPTDLQYVLPDPGSWQQHQAWHNDSWIFKNDTWIHPSKAGHAQLAKVVTGKMCSAWGQWCGTQPAWDTTPQIEAARITQELRGSVPDVIKTNRPTDLPNRTKRDLPIGWGSDTPGKCTVFEGDVVGKKSGQCTLTAYSARSGEHKALDEEYVLRVK